MTNTTIRHLHADGVAPRTPNVPWCTPETVTRYVNLIIQKLERKENPYGWDIKQNNPSGQSIKINLRNAFPKTLEKIKPILVRLFTTEDVDLTVDEIQSVLRMLDEKFIHDEFTNLMRFLISIYKSKQTYHIDGEDYSINKAFLVNHEPYWPIPNTEEISNADMLIRNHLYDRIRKQENLTKAISSYFVDFWWDNSVGLDEIAETPIGIYARDGTLLNQETSAHLMREWSGKISIAGETYYIVPIWRPWKNLPTISYYDKNVLPVLPTLNWNSVSIVPGILGISIYQGWRIEKSKVLGYLDEKSWKVLKNWLFWTKKIWTLSM